MFAIGFIIANRVIVPICIAAVFVGGCGKLRNLLKDESAQIREQVDKSVQDLTAAVDKATLAIPGERYNRLVDAAIGDDPKAREKAIAQVKKLFDIELDATYETELRFGYDDKNALRADFFLGTAPSSATVIQYCADKATFQPAVVRNALQKPLSWKETETRINMELQQAIDELGAKVDDVKHSKIRVPGFGVGDITSFTIVRQNALGLVPYDPQPQDLDKRPRTGGTKTRQDIEFQERRKKAAAHLKNALDAIYGNLQNTLPGTSLPPRDFSPVSGRPYVVVLIPDDDLKKQQEILIEVATHKKQTVEEIKAQKPKEALNQRWPVKFTKANFSANPPIECGNPATKIRYALHNITELPGITPEVLEALIKSKRAIDDWNEIRAKERVPGL